MKNYLDLLQKVLKEGVREKNRTGVDTLTIPGEMLKFDLSEGFPAPTTKKLFYETGVAPELIGFLRGTSSLKEFQDLGCKVWDKNMTDPKWLNSNQCQGPDHMGRIYGTQWRDYTGHEYKMVNGDMVMQRTSIDQIALALDEIRKDMPSRRIVVNAWNPAELDQAVLPPCHVMFQLLPHKSTNTLHMTMFQRSCDMFLGVPFNIASYATLLHLFAVWAGYKPGTLTMFLSDVHIYEDHMFAVNEQLRRTPRAAPKFLYTPHEDFKAIQPNMSSFGTRQDQYAAVRTMTADQLINSLHPSQFEIYSYYPDPAIKAPMAR